MRDPLFSGADTTTSSAIEQLFDESRTLAKGAIAAVLKAWNIQLEDMEEMQLSLESQIENLLKIDDPSSVAKIIEGFFVNALSESFVQIQGFLSNGQILMLLGADSAAGTSSKATELAKVEDIAAAFLLVYLVYHALYELASTAALYFSKGLAQANLNAENKRIGDECKGWDDELLSKINTFYASKLEKMIKSIKVTGLALNEYYQSVTFLQEVIKLVTKEMDVSGTILKSCLDDIHKSFLSSYSVQKMENMLKELDSDKWQGVPVSKFYDLIVEYLHNPALKEVREVTKEELAQQNEKLTSDDTQYWTVNSILVLLETLYDYVRMVQNLPSVSYECANKLIEILKSYNTKASYLVLGAGAVQSSKMRNITAKHLAMSAQGLSFLLGELAHIKSRVDLYLGDKAKSLIEEEFANLKKDLLKHRDDIYKKLSSLLSLRGTDLLESAKKLEFTGIPATDKPSEFAAGIAAVLQQMHNALAKSLPAEHIGLIFQEAFTEIAGKLEAVYPTLKVTGADGAKQLTRDMKEIENAVSGLGMIEGSKGIKARLNGIIDQLSQKYH